MDYNREVNQLPGSLWHRWSARKLPNCLVIPANQIPYAQQLTAATPLRFCSFETESGANQSRG